MKHLNWRLKDPLIFALCRENFKFVNILVDASFDLNAKLVSGTFKTTIIEAVIRYGSLKAIQFLLDISKEKNIDMDVTDIVGSTLLHQAIGRKDYNEDIALFIAQNKDITFSDRHLMSRNQSRLSTLHIACRFGCFKVVKYILSKCNELMIDPNITDGGGNTPLHYACCAGNIQIVEELSTIQNVNFNIASGEGGWTPLHQACSSVKTELIAYLLSNFKALINPNIPDDEGDTPLHFACEGGHVEVVEVFFNNFTSEEINVNQKNDYGLTPLHIACLHRRYEIISFMIQNSEKMNIDLDLKNEEGHTAFEILLRKSDRVFGVVECRTRKILCSTKVV